MALVTIEQAQRHLKLPVGLEPADLTSDLVRKLAQAQAIVLATE